MEEDLIVFQVVADSDCVVPFRNPAQAEVLKNNNGMTCGDFIKQVGKSRKLDCQLTTTPCTAGHVGEIRALRAGTECLRRDIRLRDLHTRPPQDHRKRRRPAIKVVLFDQRNVRHCGTRRHVTRHRSRAVKGLSTSQKKRRNQENKRAAKREPAEAF